MTLARPLACGLCSIVVLAAPVSGQTKQEGFASVLVSAATIEDGTSVSITGAIGYRFTQIVALGFEMTAIPRVRPDLPSTPSIRVADFGIPAPQTTHEREGGHANIFTANLRLDIPIRARRIAPYLVGGGGVGSVTDRIRATVVYPPIVILSIPSDVVFPPVVPQPIAHSISRTTTNFAMTIGGGVSLPVNDHLSFDADARYIGLVGGRNIQIGRYGAGATYRF